MTGEAVWPYRASQGRLVCGVEGRLTGDNGDVLPSDGKAVGELQTRGPWITASYYMDDAPEKFHDGWLRTGDVGTLDEAGFIRLTDRAKDVIKSGGEWISSMELENILMAHPSVAEAAVVGVPDEQVGRTAARRRRAARRRAPGDPGRAAGLPRRARPALAATRALGLHRRGAEDLRRQVQEDDAARPVRGRRSSR